MTKPTNREEYREFIYKVIGRTMKHPTRVNAGLGLELLDCRFKGEGSDDDEVAADFLFRPKDEHLNPSDGVHGGIIAMVFDTAAGIGAVAATGSRISTTDIACSYLRAMTADAYKVTIRYTHIGKRMINATGTIREYESGIKCAACMVTFMLSGESPLELRL